MDVSVIIVNYNTKQVILNCINSIYENTKDIEFEIIVSDNNSIDGSVDSIKNQFPKVIVLENNKNLGFGAANNRALKIATGNYILYLNSDTILLNNAIKIFYDFFEKNEKKYNIGVLGSLLLNSDKKTYMTSFGSFPSANFELYRLFKYIYSSLGLKKKNVIRNPEYLRERELDFFSVDYIQGADLFMKNTEYAHFDERYFMYFEETDMQFRFEKNGKKRYIINSPKIIHLEGVSGDRDYKRYSFAKKTSIFFWDSCIKYLRKNTKKNIAFYLLIFLLFIVFHSPFVYKKYIRNKVKREKN